ncbi:MAG: hypothetical protein SFV23_12770 [Planctomycetaceae bacterium]|nr:hypothetical protein [Planctomycetaceae bacterium]
MSSEQQSGEEFFWPPADQPGFYLLQHQVHRPQSWNWTGRAWEYMYTTASTEHLIKLGYMGVRREGFTGPVAALQPVRMPSSDEEYPQWAKDIIEAIREVRDELQAAERRAR